MLRVRATPTLGDTGPALGSLPREYQKAACYGHTVTSDQGYRWARGQRKDKSQGFRRPYRPEGPMRWLILQKRGLPDPF